MTHRILRQFLKKSKIPYRLWILLFILTSCASLDFSGKPYGYHPPLPRYSGINVAVVLGRGGAKGLAHVAVLEELTAAGIKPDLIIGCSAGAIVGGLYADDPNLVRLKKLLMEQRRENLLDLSIRHLPFGIAKGVALKHFLTQNIRAKTFDQLKIPLVVVATNLEFGDLVVFGTGPVEPAIRASAAFPGVFHPVRLNGTYFVDGGVINNVPVDVAKQLGAKFIIAVELRNTLSEASPKNLLGILKRSLEISLTSQSHQASKTADFVIRIPFKEVGIFDDHLNGQIYNLGRQAIQQALPDLKRKLKAKLTS